MIGRNRGADPAATVSRVSVAGHDAFPGAAFFRLRRLGRRAVVTNLAGGYLVLTAEELERFARGEPAGTELYARLSAGGFLRQTVDVAALTRRARDRMGFLGAGPSLHILVVTRRCNETCAYCHSSRVGEGASDADMSPETADRALDLAFQTTSPSLTVELQGGEPLLAFDVVRHVIDGALARSRRAGKALDFTLVTNLAAMDDDKLSWLLERRVQICTSIDGPADLHDAQRRLPTGSAFERAAGWIARINAEYAARGLDPTLYHVEALLTTTRATLCRPREVVDTYAALGCRALFLRPLDPFGFGARVRDRLGYDAEEYLAFYRAAVDHAIALNLAGVPILERFASIFLTKILTGVDPNYLDIRSPCGAGIGQVAYDHDGRVYTCDEGRMLAADGDDTFLLGRLGEVGYRQVVGHPTVRATVVASNLDAQPGCTQCAYRPYCGVCPVYGHRTQGSIFGRAPDSFLCAVHMGIQDYLFERLGDADPDVHEVLRRWTTARPRSHFVHVAAGRGS